MTTLTWNIVARDMASAAFGKIGHNAHALRDSVSGAMGMMSNVVGGELGNVIGNVQNSLDQIGDSVGSKMMGIGAIGATVGVGLMSMGSGIKSATSQLDAAVTASGHNVAQFKGQFNDAEKSAAHFGFGAADTANALTKLTEATNSPTTALKNMGLVENLAAAQHESLATAAGQVARVYAGGGRVLKQYGITMPPIINATKALTAAEKQHTTAAAALSDAKNKYKLVLDELTPKQAASAAGHMKLKIAADAVTAAQGKLSTANQNLSDAQHAAATNTADQNRALGELSGKLNGQAKASVSSFSGHVKVLRTEFANWADQAGSKYGPAITMVSSGMMAAGAGVDIFKTALSGSKLATEASTDATEGATGVQWLFNAALDANPLALIVLAIAAVVGALVIFLTKTKLGKEIVKDALGFMAHAFHAFKDAVADAFDWVKHNWPLLLAILTGPIGIAVLLIKDHWKEIKDGAADVVHWISDKFGDLIGFFTSMPSRIANAAKGLFNGIGDAFITAINFLIGAWDSLHFGMPSFKVFGHKIGGFTIGLPQIPKIPMLATGGDITSGGRVMVGEKGPEFLDLPRGARVTPLHKGGGDTYVTVHGFVGSERQLAQAIGVALKDARNRNAIPSLA